MPVGKNILEVEEFPRKVGQIKNGLEHGLILHIFGLIFPFLAWVSWVPGECDYKNF